MTLDVAVIGSGFGGSARPSHFASAASPTLPSSSVRANWEEPGATIATRDVAVTSRARSTRSPLCRTRSGRIPIATSERSWQYLIDVADRYRLRELIKFDHDVSHISFDPAARLWQISSNHGDFEAKCVILATGGLSEPRLPEIAGLSTFAGTIMHTARWDESVLLAGKRVGVIGTGASSIQVVPQLAPIVERLEVFQRTPSWILPHLGRPVLERTKRLFSLLPFSQRLIRAKVYWRNEVMVLGFVKDPRRMGHAETMSSEHLARQIDDPLLRERLTPTYHRSSAYSSATTSIRRSTSTTSALRPTPFSPSSQRACEQVTGCSTSSTCSSPRPASM